MSDTYAQCPQCHYQPAAPLPISEPCPACGIYTYKWGQHVAVPSHQPITKLPLRIRWAAMRSMQRIRCGLAMAIFPGFTFAHSVVSGTVSVWWFSFGSMLSRANAPFAYWSLVLSALALAVVGTCLAVVYLIKDRADSDVAALGDRLFQYVGLFCVVVVIDSIYLNSIFNDSSHEVGTTGWSVARFFLLSGLPYGVLACSDQPWGNKHAAQVCVVAWMVVYGGFSLIYPSCPKAAIGLFIPLLFSAVLGHTVGTLYHHGDWRHEIG
jgi:hypothetical protein